MMLHPTERHPADAFKVLLGGAVRWRLAEILAAAQGAYEGAAALGDRWDCDLWPFVTEGDHGVVYTGTDWAVVAVSGTDGWSDWVTDSGNLSYMPAKTGPVEMNVASGFGVAYQQIWPKVDDILRAAFPHLTVRQEGTKNNPPLVTFVGHSRGAAIAQLLALEYWMARSVYSQCVTFASPRVFAKGQKVPAEWQKQLWRVEHSNDMVTHTPPSWRCRHRGHRIFLAENGDLLEDPGIWRLIWRKLKGYSVGDSIGDHLLGDYRAALDMQN